MSSAAARARAVHHTVAALSGQHSDSLCMSTANMLMEQADTAKAATGMGVHVGVHEVVSLQAHAAGILESHLGFVCPT